MHAVYTLVRFFPYWAVPLAIVLADIGIFFKRRTQKPPMTACFSLAGALLLFSLLWLVFRGDKHSDAWVRLFFT